MNVVIGYKVDLLSFFYSTSYLSQLVYELLPFKIFLKKSLFFNNYFVWYYFMSNNIINIIINEIYLLIQNVTHMGLIVDNEHD